MKKDLSIQQLEQNRERLLQSLSLFELVKSAEAPAFLKHLNPAFAKTLLSGEELPFDRDGLCPESARFCKELATRSEKIARSFLLSDIDLFQKIKDTGNDQIHHAPGGFVEGGFPIRVQGKVVHGLWSGRFRDKPFSEDELATLAKQAGATGADLAVEAA